MMLLIWIILMCVGFDPLSAFVVSFLVTLVLGSMEDEPQVVNNYYMGGEDDDANG